MIERPMPEDILKRKSKTFGNFTAREAVLGGISVAIICAGLFSWFRGIPDQSTRALVALIPAMPFLLIGFVPIYGVPFEKIFWPIVYDNFVCPIIRKKEVHYPEIERYEKRRSWVKPGKKIKVKKCKELKPIK